jgi:subtilisin family serine protease
MKKLSLLFFSLVLLSTSILAQNSKLDSFLENKLKSEGIGESKIPVYVLLKERLSFEYLDKLTGFLPKKEKQREVVRLLKEFASSRQTNVVSYLEQQKAASLADNINIIWAINVISFEANPQVIYTLADNDNFNEIEKIFYDASIPLSMLVDDEGITESNYKNNTRVEPLRAPQAGLTLINAPQVWAAGDSGQGIIVGNLDSGTDWKHPDLVKNIWNNLGEDANGNGKTIVPNGSSWSFDPGDINGIDDDGNGKIDDFIGWNFQYNNNDPGTPLADISHGTATSGIVAGYGTGGTQTGVAPKAKLIIMKPNGESQYWASQQYCIEKGVDVITSSLSYKWYFSPKPNYGLFREMTDVELAAGVVHTNSTSNDGGYSAAPVPFNISAPGNVPGPWMHPDQTLVGGLSSVIGSANVLATTDVIVSSSPYGPATWENIQQVNPTYPYIMPLNYRDYPYQTVSGSMGLIKPDVSAPGNGTVSTAPGTGYQSFSGTSGATPHLGGVAALMLGVNNSMSPADVSRIMQTTAIEKGTPGKDNRYGAGRVDALAAINQVKAEIPVELVSFSASVTDGIVTLSWITASETNNKGFEIERESFASKEIIAFVPGKGTTTSVNSYSFSDNVNSGMFSYRLKQIDFDGTFKYSNPVNVDVSNVLTFNLSQNYPNPFNPATLIRYSVPEDGLVNLTVFNMLGEKVAELFNSNSKAGSYTVTFDGSNLNSGVYFYKIQSGNFTETRKMILAK